MRRKCCRASSIAKNEGSSLMLAECREAPHRKILLKTKGEFDESNSKFNQCNRAIASDVRILELAELHILWLAWVALSSSRARRHRANSFLVWPSRVWRTFRIERAVARLAPTKQTVSVVDTTTAEDQFSPVLKWSRPSPKPKTRTTRATSLIGPRRRRHLVLIEASLTIDRFLSRPST